MSKRALQLIAEAKEKRLTQLDLGRCGLSEIPPQVFELVWLETLSFSNEYYQRDANAKQWISIKSKNKGKPNQLSTLPKQFSKLQSLQKLILNNGEISDVSPLSGLVQLTELDLSSNKISEVSPLSGLVQLTRLELSSNKISDIGGLLNHIKRGLVVSLDYFASDKKISVVNNPLSSPPKEVIEQGNEAILAYFDSLEKQGAGKLNEAKLIIVGEPEAGKTSLMESLLDPDYILSDQTESTLGIEVREGWQFLPPDTDDADALFTVNIWDFGGQQIQYMTHQFFLTPGALYILLSANDRKEPTNFPYWFKIIHLLGEERGQYSPVLVVLNEKDDQFIHQFNFDLNFYRKRYPELQITQCEVNLAKRDGRYQALQETVQRQLTQLPHVSHDRPARWNDIRTDLRALAQQKDYIDFSQYAAICQHYAVNEEASQKVFSGYLHRLGSLLHFVDDPSLRDFIILKPQWAVDAVYSVLVDNEITRNGGYFSQAKLDAVWKAYSIPERNHLLNFMKRENFEICYALKGNANQYIAPQLLTQQQAKYTWDDSDSLKFRFQYSFMPEGIITRLIVRMNEQLAHGEHGDLMWNKGMVLAQAGCQAQVIETENRKGLKMIDIAVTGEVSERKYLLRNIREQVTAIHKKWFKNIQSEAMIPCNCDYCANPEQTDIKFFELSVLERGRRKGKLTIECDKDFLDVSIMGLLEGIFEDQEIRQQSDAIKPVGKQEVHIHVNPPAPLPPEPVVTPTEEKKPVEEKKNMAGWQQAGFSGVLAALLTTLLALGVLLNWVSILPAGLISLGLGSIAGGWIYKVRSASAYSANPYRVPAYLALSFVLLNNTSWMAGKLNLSPEISGHEIQLQLQWG